MLEQTQEISPRWIKLVPATKYSSIGKDRLKMLAKKGIVIGFPDPDNKRGDWLFDKESIDNYQLKKAPKSIEQKMVEFRAGKSL